MMIKRTTYHLIVSIFLRNYVPLKQSENTNIIPFLANTGCFNTLAPPFHSQTGHLYIPKLYVFRTLYQFPITMQVFRTIAQFTFFQSHGLCVKVEHIFMNNFSLYFWGGFPKMATKSSIIALDSYIIPHFKANISCYASVLQQHLFHKPVLCE